jgi:hypothetical protein
VLGVARSEMLLLTLGLAFSSVMSIPDSGVGRPEPWPMLIFATLAAIHVILAYRLAEDRRARSATFVLLTAWAVVFLFGALLFLRLPLYVITLGRPESSILLLALGLLTGGTALRLFPQTG